MNSERAQLCLNCSQIVTIIIIIVNHYIGTLTIKTTIFIQESRINSIHGSILIRLDLEARPNIHLGRRPTIISQSMITIATTTTTTITVQLLLASGNLRVDAPELFNGAVQLRTKLAYDHRASVDRKPLAHFGFVNDGFHGVLFLIVGVQTLEDFRDVRDSKETMNVPESLRLIGGEIRG
ncbi:hypothetical protein OROMI_000482 [Orobanche minor]